MTHRIGLDCLFADPERVFGLWNHASTLIRALLRLDQTNEYIVFLNGAAKAHFSLRAPNLRLVTCDFAASGPYSRILAQNTWLMMQAREQKIDLLHSPANYGPIDPFLPRLVTTHDLLPFFEVDGSWKSRIRASGLDALMALSLRNARMVIVASAFTAAELRAKFSLGPQSLRVIHLGVDPPPGDSQPPTPAAPPYILTTGLYAAHKNIPRLIQAFAVLKRDFGIPHRLMLVGKSGDQKEALANAARASGCPAWIDFPGYVEEDRLHALYRGADLYVCPSLMEGFGLPLVEAMSMGTPVVSSNAGSLPEIVPLVEATFDPCDVDGMARVIHRALTDRHWREELAVQGRRQAKYFSGERMAQETLAAYKEVIANG